MEVQREVSRLIRSMHSLRVVRSAEELPEIVREYFRNRLGESSAVLSNDSSKLAEALIEILELIVGESEIAGWRPPALEDAHSRIGECHTPPIAFLATYPTASLSSCRNSSAKQPNTAKPATARNTMTINNSTAAMVGEIAFADIFQSLCSG